MSQPISSDAIAAAAEARLRAANVAPSPNSTPASTIESSAAARREMVTFKSKIRVIIDKEISAHSGADISTRCLALTSTLFTNVLDNPDEAKYRVFKSAQPRIAEQILKVEGAKNLLVACGFGTCTLDFKHEWFLAETIRPGTLGWQRLGWANEVLKERNEEIKGRADKKREMAERERAAEKTRKKAALAAAEEDRERVARRAQTEKLRYAREIEEKRKAELAKAMASPAETSTSAEAPGSFNAAGPPPPTAMDEDEDELAEDGDEDDKDGDSDEEKPLTKNWGSGGRTLTD